MTSWKGGVQLKLDSLDALRRQTWPSAVFEEVHQKLWGTAKALRRTADFAIKTSLTFSMAGNAVEEEHMEKEDSLV